MAAAALVAAHGAAADEDDLWRGAAANDDAIFLGGALRAPERRDAVAPRDDAAAADAVLDVCGALAAARRAPGLPLADPVGARGPRLLVPTAGLDGVDVAPAEVDEPSGNCLATR